MSFEIKTKNSFSVPVKRVSKTSSPVDFYSDKKQMELKCTFKGWPRPRVVWSNPKNKQIINGSEGFYISEQLDEEDTLTSLLRNPDIQENQAGAYKCTGMNNITSCSTEKSGIIDLIYGFSVQKVDKTSSSVDYYPNTTEMELKCTFKGWPRPRVVWYNPDKKQIINGSEGFYISEQLDREDTLTSLLRNPDIQEKHAGAYKCTGMNTITGWSTELSAYIDLHYRCLLPKAPQITSLEVSKKAYLNVRLKCRVGVSPSDCDDNSLQWYFNNSSVKLKSGEKYVIQERKTNTKCKKDFILKIVNATDADKGEYKCRYVCNFGYSRSSTIQLKVFPGFLPKAPQRFSPTVSVEAYFNISLECEVGVRPSDCWDNSLGWYFNNNSGKIVKSEKYDIQERRTNTRCKKDFILTIFNVTEADEGKYKCHWLCDEYDPSFSRSSIIKLKVFPPSEEDSSTPSSQNNINSTSTAPADTGAVAVAVATAHDNNKSAGHWITATAILTSGFGLVLIVLTAYHFISKKFGKGYRACKHDFEKGVKSHQLFVSYSSKDMAWINENLIPILENKKISYSIHTRDFELGLPIVQNMADSVYGSRKVLIVLSDNYLASNFCREELHMAVQREADSRDSSLILVAIDKLKKKKLPGALRNKHLLDFEKLKIKQDWEKKLLNVVAGPGAKVA
ncbi:uncharacterized protein [Porites lutea]|uniref:uncharacterized protein n=1 Tax=Porites lutea TaxID=51062 RepID=UPI003CC57226